MCWVSKFITIVSICRNYITNIELFLVRSKYVFLHLLCYYHTKYSPSIPFYVSLFLSDITMCLHCWTHVIKMVTKWAHLTCDDGNIDIIFSHKILLDSFGILLAYWALFSFRFSSMKNTRSNKVKVSQLEDVKRM